MLPSTLFAGLLDGPFPALPAPLLEMSRVVSRRRWARRPPAGGP
jgi:hypothetical protein